MRRPPKGTRGLIGGGVNRNFSINDLQAQIRSLQRQVIFLTKQLQLATAARTTPKRQKKRATNNSKLVAHPPSTECKALDWSDFKWHSCKRFTVSRKNMPPSRAFGYAERAGVFYLKLPKGQVTRLTKVTRLTYRGVTLTSKKSMRLVLTGEKPLVIPPKPVRGKRSDVGKLSTVEDVKKWKASLKTHSAEPVHHVDASTSPSSFEDMKFRSCPLIIRSSDDWDERVKPLFSPCDPSAGVCLCVGYDRIVISSKKGRVCVGFSDDDVVDSVFVQDLVDGALIDFDSNAHDDIIKRFLTRIYN